MGFKLAHDITTLKAGCPDCLIPQTQLTYTLDAFEFNFEICPSCWNCRELFPVYEGDHSKANRSRFEMMFSLLTTEQLQLLDSIIATMIMD